MVKRSVSRTVATALQVGLAVASLSCSGRSSEVQRVAALPGTELGGPSAPARVEPAAETRLIVHNGSFQDVRVAARRNGVLFPLGTVGSMERRTFLLRPSLVPRVGTLSFQALTTVDRGTFSSAPVLVTRGDTVHFEIGFHLVRSSVSVWDG